MGNSVKFSLFLLYLAPKKNACTSKALASGDPPVLEIRDSIIKILSVMLD